jgi:hypothetical protein
LALGGAGRVLAALTIPLIPALGAAVLVWALDRYEREPLLLLLAAFLWGAVIAIPPALYIERALTAALGASSASTISDALAQALTAGVTEELIKGAGLLILLLLLRDEFDNVTDGVIYGAASGLGFAMTENSSISLPSSHSDWLPDCRARPPAGWDTRPRRHSARRLVAREAHGSWTTLSHPGAAVGLLAALLPHTLDCGLRRRRQSLVSAGARGPWVGAISAPLDLPPSRRRRFCSSSSSAGAARGRDDPRASGGRDASGIVTPGRVCWRRTRDCEQRRNGSRRLAAPG